MPEPLSLPIGWVRSQPTCWPFEQSTGGIHESVLRSHQVLSVVRQLLEHGTPHEVILGLIDEMERADD